MLTELKELWKFRELLISMVQRELKIRYKNSFLGFFWSLVNPLVTVLVMTLVFKGFVGNRTPNLSAYILAAYLPYMFFQMCLLDSAQSVLGALPLIRKIYFPREILPLASVASNFVHFALALGVFFVFQGVIYVFNPEVSPFRPSALMLPVLLVINLALVTGLSLLFSALNTFYEDVKYILSVVLYLLLFLSPVFYFSEEVLHSAANERSQGLVYFLYHLNPVATLCTAYKKALVAPQDVITPKGTLDPLPFDWVLLGVTTVMSFGFLVLGYHVFNRMKWRFVERP